MRPVFTTTSEKDEKMYGFPSITLTDLEKIAAETKEIPVISYEGATGILVVGKAVNFSVNNGMLCADVYVGQRIQERSDCPISTGYCGKNKRLLSIVIPSGKFAFTEPTADEPTVI